MIAILLSDWSDWVKKDSLRTMVLMIVVLAAIAGLTFFRPEALMEGLTFFLIWFGYRAGRQIWSGAESWAWVGRAGLSPSRAIIGKFMAVVGIVLFHMIVASPVLLIMVMAWGVTWPIMGWALLSMLLATETAAAISRLFHLLRPENRYICGMFVAAWLLLTAIMPWLQSANPMGQVWSVIVPGGISGSGYYWIINGLMTVGLWGITGFVLRKEVEPNHVTQSSI